MSADREMDHLEMMSDMCDRHWNQPYCYAEVEDDLLVGGDTVPRLARPKCELTQEGIFEQRVRSAASVLLIHTGGGK